MKEGPREIPCACKRDNCEQIAVVHRVSNGLWSLTMGSNTGMALDAEARRQLREALEDEGVERKTFVGHVRRGYDGEIETCTRFDDDNPGLPEQWLCAEICRLVSGGVPARGWDGPGETAEEYEITVTVEVRKREAQHDPQE